MLGIDRITGRTIAGKAQLASRLREILTTCLGEVAKRREFGANFIEWLGRDVSETFLAELQHHAIAQFQKPVNGLPDVDIRQVKIDTKQSRLYITVIAILDNESINLELTL